MLKRVFLFMLTNIAVLAVISIVFRLLGLDGVLDEQGVDLDLRALLIMAAIIGFSGSLISLAISKWSAKRMSGARVIDPDNPGGEWESWLLATVDGQARNAGIGMPEVAIFESEQPNAFATGWNRNNALVAVSTGLLRNMRRKEIEAVLAHEVSHVANGDMVTLTLIQGVVNTFVIFFSRIIGHVVDRVVFKTERGHGPAFIITSIIAQLVLGVLATMIVMWFSRWREFRADAGGARLAGTGNMIAALDRLRSGQQAADVPEQLEAMAISGRQGGGFRALFMSHPPLEDRIAALQASSRQNVIS